VTSSLDASGLKCPLPVLKARKKLKTLAVNSTLEVIATDPGAVEDFMAYCKSSGHTLVKWHVNSGIYKFLLRKEA